MTERIPQSTSKMVVFKAYLSSDHVSEATGKTIAITISKNGGAFGNPNAGATNATEISSGWYKVTLDTTDTGTLGPLAVRGAVATVDDVGVLLEVVSATSGGYTNLDAAVTTRLAPTTAGRTLDVTAGGAAGIDWANIENQNNATNLTATTVANVTDVATVINVTGNVGGEVVGNVGGVLGSVTVSAIFADVITASALAADAVAEIQSGLATAAALTTVDDFLDTEIAAIKAKTDQLTFGVANVLNANITHVNELAITGSGVEDSDEWRPA
jgi:hypothetical protein